MSVVQDIIFKFGLSEKKTTLPRSQHPVEPAYILGAMAINMIYLYVHLPSFLAYNISLHGHLLCTLWNKVFAEILAKQTHHSESERA